MPDFDKEKLTKYNWDTKKGTSMFRRDNSGLYIRVAGRYINTGKNLFLRLHLGRYRWGI